MIREDGTIEISEPLCTITPRTTHEEFLASPLFAIAEPWIQNAPWSNYTIGPITLCGENFAGMIFFQSGKLFSIHPGSLRPEFGVSWNDYSPGLELDRHCFHKRFLRTMLKYPPRNEINLEERSEKDVFPLKTGLVLAYLDTCKTNDAVIEIRYGQK